MGFHGRVAGRILGERVRSPVTPEEQSEEAKDSTQLHNSRNKTDSFQAVFQKTAVDYIELVIIYYWQQRHIFNHARSSSMLRKVCENIPRTTSEHQTRVTMERLRGFVVPLEASGGGKFQRTEKTHLRSHYI